MPIYKLGQRINYTAWGDSKKGTIRVITRINQYPEKITDYMALQELNTTTASGPYIYKIEVEPDGTTDKHYESIGVYNIDEILTGGRRKSRNLRKTRRRKHTKTSRH